MKRAIFASGFLLPFLGALSAEAADLQINAATKFIAPPPFTWTGLYLGGNVGSGIGTTETSVGSVLHFRHFQECRSPQRHLWYRKHSTASSAASRLVTIGRPGFLSSV